MSGYLDLTEVRAAQKARSEETPKPAEVVPEVQPEPEKVEAPVESGAPEPEVEAPAAEPAVIPETKPEPGPEDHDKNRVPQKRLDEVVRQRNEARIAAEKARQEKAKAEADAAYLRGLLEGKGVTPAPQATEPDPSQDPIAIAVAAALAKRDAEAQAKSLADKIQEARTKYPDLQNLEAEVGPLDTGPHAMEAIKASDNVGELYNYLFHHPDEARALATMTPIQAAKTIGRLEATLAVVPAPKPPPVAPTPTPKPKPPAPPNPVKPTNSTAPPKKHNFEAY